GFTNLRMSRALFLRKPALHMIEIPGAHWYRLYLRLGNFISGHRQDYVGVDLLEDHDDESPVGNVPENTRPTRSSADARGLKVLQYEIDIVRGQVMCFDVLDIAAARRVPNDLRPFHAAISD